MTREEAQMSGSIGETNEAIRCLANPAAWPCRDAGKLRTELAARRAYLVKRCRRYEAELRHCSAVDASFYREWLAMDRTECLRISAAIGHGAA